MLLSASVATLICLLIPSWRETASLLLRIELLQHGPDLTVHGYKPGCVIYALPFVEMSARARSRMETGAATSKEDWLVAQAFGSAPKPSSTLWLEDPLLPWIALEHAGEIELLLAARQREPTNGALWAAEACARPHDRDASQALLDEALLRQPWTTHAREAQARVFSAQVRAGLPRIGALYWASRAGRGREYLEYCLQDIFTEALQSAADDPPRTRQTIDRFARLKSVTWAENGGPFLNNLGMVALSAYRLRGNQWNPPEAVIRRALDHRASPTAVAVVAAHADYSKHRWDQQWWDAYNEMEVTFAVALWLLAVTLSLAVWRVPFAIARRAHPSGGRWVLWCLTASASVWLIARSLEAIGLPLGFNPVPVGLGPHPHPHWPIPWTPLGMVALLGLCWRVVGSTGTYVLLTLLTLTTFCAVGVAVHAAQNLETLSLSLAYSF